MITKIMVCDSCLTEKNKTLYKVWVCGEKKLFCSVCREYETGIKERKI